MFSLSARLSVSCLTVTSRMCTVGLVLTFFTIKSTCIYISDLSMVWRKYRPHNHGYQDQQQVWYRVAMNWTRNPEFHLMDGRRAEGERIPCAHIETLNLRSDGVVRARFMFVSLSYSFRFLVCLSLTSNTVAHFIPPTVACLSTSPLSSGIVPAPIHPHHVDSECTTAQIQHSMQENFLRMQQ